MTVSGAFSRPGWAVVAEYENLPGRLRPWAAVCG
ncbi:hypothetical protein RKD28_002116 [Streptomyces sp. SAI-229]